jgi:2-oxoisovalerate dehydrogenase E1 component alpha subunit
VQQGKSLYALLKRTSITNPRVRFPGAVDSKFTSALSFEHPSTYPAIPTYRCTSPDGDIVDPSVKPGPDSLALSMYENMLSVSIMDLIMFDAQRQGRLSFYMTSQGEEGTCVGSASALEKDDVVFSQYREAGVFVQRGYTFEEFMSQLFANRKDAGRGRNMPVHYGSAALKIVHSTISFSKTLMLIKF